MQSKEELEKELFDLLNITELLMLGDIQNIQRKAVIDTVGKIHQLQNKLPEDPNSELQNRAVEIVNTLLITCRESDYSTANKPGIIFEKYHKTSPNQGLNSKLKSLKKDMSLSSDANTNSEQKPTNENKFHKPL